jgi:hypothetical protein
MTYQENHLFFKRHAELLPTHIHVWGTGILHPCYDMKFPYAELSPDPRKVKIPSKFTLLPFVLMTLLSVVLFMLTGYFGDIITHYPMGFFVVTTILLCLATLGTFFRRRWWWIYVNGYGAVCFGITQTSNSAKDFESFNAELVNRITEARKASAPASLAGESDAKAT